MTILNNLISDCNNRLEGLTGRNSHVIYLKDSSAEDLISNAYPFILSGLEKNSTLVEIAGSIGRRIRQKLAMYDDSIQDVHCGWFVLVSFLECGILKYGLKHVKRGKKYQSYYLYVENWKAIKELWSTIDRTKVDLWPQKEPPDPWVSSIHSTGTPIVKKATIQNLRKIQRSKQRKVFQCLNKLQSQAWRVNRKSFAVFQEILSLEDPQHSPLKYHRETGQAKKSLLIEAEAIERMALSNLNDPFYHLYNLDFRHRVYCNTPFLNEQSSDVAKGILKFDERRPLGEHGWKWLTIHTANSFGFDKATLADRQKFVEDRLTDIVGYATQPLVNWGWMEADAPFAFLSACFEIRDILEWESEGRDRRDFPSGLVLYIDG